MITLVLGGTRSGKSEYAEWLAGHAGGPVTYVATASTSDGDEDFASRIEVHRLRRPAGWSTVEVGSGLVACVAELDGTVLIDSLGTWVASSPDFAVDVEGFCTALVGRSGRTVVVSEEVGLGVHPSTEVGGRFRDALGLVNRAVSQAADEAILVVAGRPLRLGSSWVTGD